MCVCVCVCVCACVCVYKTCESESEVAQSCLTLCNPVDCRPPGSCVHGISQARILEWVAISFSRWSSQPRDRNWVSLYIVSISNSDSGIANRVSTTWNVSYCFIILAENIFFYFFSFFHHNAFKEDFLRPLIWIFPLKLINNSYQK